VKHISTVINKSSLIYKSLYLSYQSAINQLEAINTEKFCPRTEFMHLLAFLTKIYA